METAHRPVQSLDEFDLVRSNAPSGLTRQVDQELYRRLVAYAALPAQEIDQRIVELEQEWDIDRLIQFQAASTALLGLWLAFKVNWKWIWLTLINQGFLLNQSIQGWCPPVVMHRALKRRTRRELDLEVLALRVLRGDFQNLSLEGDAASRARRALEVAAARR